MFTDSVLCYFKNCIDTVILDKRIWVYPNQKPWITQKVQQLLRERDTAYRAGNRELYSAARANLKRCIREAKANYRRRGEEHLDTLPTTRLHSELLKVTSY